eukprot:TRINITY_DN59467_c0_g1_i1.p1 TRINITY_DN59467_c0_g1~~TRINITY_DN59467_c0_g1_i1.p1  ORF type:complete len:499 (-),score=27.10 TRINITY_DN59467_c0_g1_i1:99-1595(-)
MHCRTTSSLSTIVCKCQTGELAADLISFAGRDDLLRASRVHNILWKCGSIFASSNGTAATYQLSEQVPYISYFISHNWSVPRWKKFMALTFYFNGPDAFAASALSLLCIVFASRYGVLPPNNFGWCRIVCIPMFALVLMLGSDFKALIRRTGPLVFLDKTCIHQENRELQRLGIEKLGAFIHKSDHMLVLHTDIYSQKLWTVYELACFLSYRNVDDMTMLPINRYVGLAGGLSIAYSVQLIKPYLIYKYNVPLLGQIIFISLIFFCGVCFIFLHRSLARMRRETVKVLSSFSVLDCICTCESDRPFVYNNIHRLMRGAGYSVDCDEEQSLNRFNQLVREEFLPAFSTARGIGLWSKYRELAVGLLLLALPDLADEFVERMTWSPRAMLLIAKSRLTLCLIYGPGVGLMCNYFASKFEDLRGYWEIIYVLSVFLVAGILPLAGMFSFWYYFSFYYELSSTLGLVVLGFNDVVNFVALMQVIQFLTVTNVAHGRRVIEQE